MVFTTRGYFLVLLNILESSGHIPLTILRSFSKVHKHLDYYSLLLSLFFLFLIFLSVVIKIKLFLFNLESVHFHELVIINGFVSFHPHKNANQVWVDQWDNLIYGSLSNPLELSQQDLKEIYLPGSSYLAWEACKEPADFSLPSSWGGVKGIECNSESFPFFLLSCILRSHILWCLRNLVFLVAHISLLSFTLKSSCVKKPPGHSLQLHCFSVSLVFLLRGLPSGNSCSLCLPIGLISLLFPWISKAAEFDSICIFHDCVPSSLNWIINKNVK